MALNNPEILYVRRYATPEGMEAWVYRGRIVVVPDEVSDFGRGYVEVTGPDNGPTGNLIPWSHLVPVAPSYEPAREITHDEQATIAIAAMHEERYTDYWFTQQTSLEVLKAYRMGYEAREKEQGYTRNPMPLGGPDENLLHFAWANGYDRHSNMEQWRKEDNAWKNPGY